jgi:hypothetical protein
MELVLMEIGSKEWEYIWHWLSIHPINQGLDNPTDAPNQGQAWAYMGSFKQGDRVLHTVRHLCHPSNNGLKEYTFNASSDLTPDQIKKKFRL